ncbi:MAG: hypothetical protein ABIN80_03985 [Dyadobacter sp.]|uniref:hypothetical protein n=1 Tax=Dyadobacter sp. TaxID=1914288 RepID=UPI00326390C8
MKKHSPVKRAIFRSGKFLLIGLFVLTVSLFFLYPQLFYCELIGFSSFRSEAGTIYFSPDVNPVYDVALKRVVRQAETRVDSFYSGKKSKPIIIICSNPQEYQKYCSSTEGAGCSLGTPWGHSFVVLNGREMNIDVVGHEMGHTELLERLGWWTIATEIPQWFNEGLALMLDKRFVNNPDPAGRYLDYMDEWMYYTGGGQEISELKDMETIKGFFSGGQKRVMRAYMSSGMEVSYWLTLAGDDGLKTLISEIKKGRSFDDAYRETEKQRLKTYFKRLPANPLRLGNSKKISE